ncbi:MAG TPA: hypothetical protein VH394_08320 [Thermoanaerobaculia bacterium]|jgi:hypothetical protein|nr:hypothetical protein [Thermoanaerobaculia bacterium]
MLLDVLRELFPVLAILYLLEGLAWVGARSFLFVRWPWGWRVAEGRGIRTAGFFPFDFSATAPGPVVIATADALLLPDPEAHAGNLYDPERWVRLGYDQASSGVEEGTVRLGDRHKIRFPSRAHADEFAELLAEIRPLSPENRAKRLAKHRARAFDFQAAEKRLVALRDKTELLRILGWGLFVFLLLLLPAVLYLHPRPDLLLLPLLAGILLLYGAVLLAMVYAGRSLHRQGALIRRPSLLPIVFSPVAATRAAALLAKDLFAGFDPLLLAALLLKKESFLERARAELYGAGVAAGRGDQSWKCHWEERRKAVVRLLDRFEVSEAEALAPPARQDASAQAWCPVCGTEYQSAGGDCDDCGLPLAGILDQT